MNKTTIILVILAIVVVAVVMHTPTAEAYTPLRAAWRYAFQETHPNVARRVSGPFDRCGPEEWPCRDRR